MLWKQVKGIELLHYLLRIFHSKVLEAKVKSSEIWSRAEFFKKIALYRYRCNNTFEMFQIGFEVFIEKMQRIQLFFFGGILVFGVSS